MHTEHLKLKETKVICIPIQLKLASTSKHGGSTQSSARSSPVPSEPLTTQSEPQKESQPEIIPEAKADDKSDIKSRSKNIEDHLHQVGFNFFRLLPESEFKMYDSSLDVQYRIN